MATWPSTLPQSPLLAGFSRSKRNPSVEFNPDGGKTTSLVFYTAVPDVMNFNLLLFPAQRTILNNFYFTTLVGGQLTFDFRDPDDNSIKTWRFVGGPPSFTSQGTNYLASMTFEEQV